ncbi:MAG: hypothetical protein WBM00_03170 [Solirubrobacterales bacterium]
MLTQLKPFRLRLATMAIGVVALVMLLPAAALATPSTITSVTINPPGPSTTGNKATVTWSLPAGYKSGTIEVAKNPATGSDGRFIAQNLDTFAFLTSSQTSWAEYIGAGTHYVHVSDCPEAAFFCNPLEEEEWSNVYPFVVPEPPLPPMVPGGGSPGSPGGGKLPGVSCSRAANAVRYVGTTRQGGKVCFTLSRNHKQVRTIKFKWQAGCDTGSAEGVTTVPNARAQIHGNGQFEYTTSDLTFAGKIKGKRAHGALRIKVSGGSCDSGRVNWNAHKG